MRYHSDESKLRKKTLNKRVARRINRRAQALLAHGIATEIHWVPGHSGIPGNEEADRQANIAREAKGSTIIERPYTSASNRARRISEGRSAAKAQWEADKCSKHFGYRLKGKGLESWPMPAGTGVGAVFHGDM